MKYLRPMSIAVLVLAFGCSHVKTGDCPPHEGDQKSSVRTPEDASGVSPASEKKCPVEIRYPGYREMLERGNRR